MLPPVAGTGDGNPLGMGTGLMATSLLAATLRSFGGSALSADRMDPLDVLIGALGVAGHCTLRSNGDTSIDADFMLVSDARVSLYLMLLCDNATESAPSGWWVPATGEWTSWLLPDLGADCIDPDEALLGGSSHPTHPRGGPSIVEEDGLEDAD